jgi:hypothetical protein
MIDAAAVALYGSTISCKLGFLVAEKYDFGTAQKINSLFTAILKVTPFSKDEARIYSEFLRDRNLLVHHGGTYTMSYLGLPGIPAQERKDQAFWGSRVIGHEDVVSVVSFLRNVARKTTRVTREALLQYADACGIAFGEERKRAIDLLSYCGRDDA